MTFRESILLLSAKTTITVAMIVALAACGDPKYQAPAIAVTFSNEFPPPTALATSVTAGIAAVVSNGPENASVTFTCIPTGKCGTFSPNPVASNVPTNYQAPSVVPIGNTVTVTATSVTDPTKFISATVTID
ncbi:MAG: hypothetical protein WBD25_06945 [Terriglobales bacterium]|jgi:hypothetical protein